MARAKRQRNAVSKAAATPPPETVPPERVEHVVRWFLTGNRPADIIASISAEWPDQPLRPLLKAAADDLARDAGIKQDVLFGWCLQASREVYRRMLDIGDLVGALRAIKQIADLAKAIPPPPEQPLPPPGAATPV
jgi:hypothetical protein